MYRNDFYYLSADGETQIHGVEWLPEGKIRAVLQISHGITEHIGRYENLAGYFTERGYMVTGNDHLGHGTSIKNKESFMFCGNWDFLVRDTCALLQRQKERYTEIPYFILGFSLGSFVVRDAAARRPHEWDGIILMGTGMKPDYQLSLVHFLVKREAGKIGEENSSPFIQNLSFGTYNRQVKPNRTEYDWLCQDPDGLQNYINDELCGKYISAGLFRELLHGMMVTNQKKVIEGLAKSLPILLISGDQDPVGSQKKDVVRVSKAFKKAKLNQVTAVFYPGRHDILHEACREKVVDKLYEWIEAQRNRLTMTGEVHERG